MKEPPPQRPLLPYPIHTSSHLQSPNSPVLQVGYFLALTARVLDLKTLKSSSLLSCIGVSGQEHTSPVSHLERMNRSLYTSPSSWEARLQKVYCTPWFSPPVSLTQGPLSYLPWRLRHWEPVLGPGGPSAFPGSVPRGRRRGPSVRPRLHWSCLPVVRPHHPTHPRLSPIRVAPPLNHLSSGLRHQPPS